MSIAGKGYLDPQESTSVTSNNASNCCSEALAELKIYQAFIFSVPILFAFILLLLFYLFYLRRQRVDWSSLRMRTSSTLHTLPDDLSRCEMGLKKEVREMLPIIVFKESFSVKDTQCSVCLGDYQADDKLQQIPACRHTFHMDCIDHWLATHNTCPLCRHSIIAPTKASAETPVGRAETSNERASSEQDADENVSESCECPQVGQSNSEPDTREETEQRQSSEEENGRRAEAIERTPGEQDADETSHQSGSESCEGPQVSYSISEPETREEIEQKSSNDKDSIDHIVPDNRDSRNYSDGTM